MTDRYTGFTVTLEKEMRSDDAQAIINAIQQIRGVESVGPVVADVQGWIAQERARIGLVKQLTAVLMPKAVP